MDCIYPVVIVQGSESKRYSPEFQTGYGMAVGWKRVLQAARMHGQAYCCCPGHGNKQLTIRHYDTSASFGLARYPLTGEEHSRDCRFYAHTANKSGLAGYEKGVIEEGPNGTTKIRLGIGLSRRDPPTLDSPAGRSVHGKTNAQPSMTLLGLLHLLWTEARLNVWWPAMKDKRSLSRIGWWINEAAQHIVVANKTLDSVLLRAASMPKCAAAILNEQRVTQAIEDKGRLIVIAPLPNWKADLDWAAAGRLRLAGYHGMPHMILKNPLRDSVEKRFAHALATWRRGNRVMVIAQIEPWEGQNGIFATVVNLALMPVTQDWLPVDSAYEHIIADLLTDAGRAFIKPLRFDADTDTVFPDFILTDTATDVPMEVFGRTDEAYKTRKAVKERYYAETFGIDGWWCWNAATDPNQVAIPPFPESAARSR